MEIRKITLVRRQSMVVAPSCTINEAVARLLGWLPGDMRSGDIQKTKHGISDEQLPLTLTLEEPYMDVLSDRQRAAEKEFNDAQMEKATQEVIEEKLKSIYHWQNVESRAMSYETEIKWELDKGDASELRVSHRATMQHNTLCIYRRGLERWAQKKYQLSVFQFPEDTNSDDISDAEPEPQQEDTTLEGGLGKVKADNLYTSFAFLVEAFSASAAAYHDDNGPIVIAIAKRIEHLAKEAYGGTEFFPSQGHGAIKKNIVEAMRRKKFALNNK